MEKNYDLAKWLNDEMTESELADFKTSPDFEKYKKIKTYSAQLKVPEFDENAILKNIFEHKKSISKGIPFYSNWIFRLAAIFVLALTVPFMMQNFVSETNYSDPSKKTTFSLPDNSEVVLNSGSNIKFKKWNWNNNRILKLNGEAYFKVAKGKKFKVETSLGNVTVLGTKFNVKARKKRFDITCYEGRVKVNYKDKELILIQGQSVSFDDEMQLNALTSGRSPEWLKNQVAFSKEKLRNILDEIERQYNVRIEIKNDNPEELFSGKIPTDNLDTALQIIGSTYHLTPNKINSTKIIFEVKNK